MNPGMHVDAIRGQTVGDVVARFPATARVFQSYRIDFCCHGEVKLEDALRGRAERPEEILAELEIALRAPVAASDPPADGLSVPALVGRIIERHHGYLRRSLPLIAPLVEKVAAVHGDRDPDLRALHQTFSGLREQLDPHLDEEEAVLFPLLMSRTADRARVASELGRMRADHLEVGALLGELRRLSHDFFTPEWACRSYRLLLAELEDLESDLLRHIHLENHVLMPRFVATATPPLADTETDR